MLTVNLMEAESYKAVGKITGATFKLNANGKALLKAVD